ncbi:YbhB/YbcL family Raf kinase inhibitor-like protein [Thalassoroseus pseudoceratinae]|uniref:YbhB/YbcL family Raf kinase inhibitor-like protein n=1 Tax=Thalassoroseus pseudoceratinae TaxID=2713176 RepID=UPI0014240C62|nr:YbhB/YbcL family Raf kinase inhibitor-like protein [Thalassoroseus pseudoceratinae]
MAEQGFTLTSPAFQPDAVIPDVHTCDGDDKSPELNWIHPPEGTKSFVLIMEDPDAPDGTFTHWVLFDIPAQRSTIPEGASGIGQGARNDFQHDHYGGPAPPPNHGDHRYYFRLYALDGESLGLEAGVKREEVEQAMQGHILDETELMGRYQRTTG